MLHFVSIATSEGGCLPYLRQSFDRFNYPLNVLGLGKKWRGFGWRWLLIEEFLKDKEDDDIVCHIDAYDVMLVRDPKDGLVEKFQELTANSGLKFLVSRETIATLMVEYWLTYCSFFTPVDGVFPNAGTWIATKRDFLKFMRMVRLEPKYDFSARADDQVILSKFISLNRDLIQLDMLSQIFFVNTSPFFGFYWNDLAKVNTKSRKFSYDGFEPYIVHGPGKTNMAQFIQDLGYEMSEKDIEWCGKQQKKYFTIFAIVVLLLSLIPLYYLRRRSLASPSSP